MAKTRIGTSFYRSEKEAKQAYGAYYETAVEEGAISVGKPELKPGDKLLVDKTGRYFIETESK